jgi:hypothetical protein
MQDREAVKANTDLDKAVRQNIKGELLVPVLENLIHAAKFTRDELAATGGMHLFQADDLLGAFLRSRVIRKGEANTWEITKPGKGWMADQINGTKPKDDTKETRKPRVRKV